MLRRDWLRRPALKKLLEVGLERLAICEAGLVLESNEAFAYYLGYDPEELRGMPLKALLSFDSEAPPEDALPHDTSPYLREATATLRGGKTVAVEVASKTLEVGRRTLELVALRDLSVPLNVQNALRRYQAELERNNRELERANRVKSEFLATISHEIRTPLTTVIGYAQLLEEDSALSAEGREYLTHIQASGVQLLGLVEGLIDLSRLESGELVLYREDVTLSSVLERALAKLRGALAAKGQTLQVRGSAEVVLSADPLRLEQILSAYLSNASKFTPLGGHLELSLSRDGDELRCEVADNGIGVAADDLPHIFQPFFQVDSLQSRSQSGAGLGLALAKRLAELHGGRVWAESELGQGSCFGVALAYKERHAATGLPLDYPARPDPS